MKTLQPWPLALAVTLALVACRERVHEAHASPSAAAVPWAQSSSSVAPPSLQLSKTTFPVKWAEDLNLSSLSDVDARLSAADTLGFGELARGAERLLPKTCNQWAALRAKGYEPSTALEAQADGDARLRCGTLTLLKNARPSNKSFVRDVAFDSPSVLSILPASLATAESKERSERVATFSKEGKSLADFDPKAHALKAPGQRLTVAEGDGQSHILLAPEAWGDFNGDGLDDVALAVHNVMTRGSYATTRLVLLTRTAPTGVLRVIEASKPARP
jgi:hypothetical protein